MRVRRSTADGPGPVAISEWAPSRARRLLRRPIVSWGLAGGLAIAAGAIVAHITADAARLRDGYGSTRQVLVTDETVAAGALVAPVVTRRPMPAATVPDDAVDRLEPGATAASPISAGAVLTRQDIAGADGLRADEAAVAVPTGPTVPPMGPGTAVWVVIAADPYAGLEAALVPGRVLAAGDEAVTVVVAVTDLTMLGAATGAGVAGLALRGE